jgi:hypothetical protein
MQSSGFRDERPNARFGSLPAKTSSECQQTTIRAPAGEDQRTVIAFPRSIGLFAAHVEHVALNHGYFACSSLRQADRW